MYSGIEYDLNKRLLFFEKDSFPKKGETYDFLKKLENLKYPSCFKFGQRGGQIHSSKTPLLDKVLAFERTKEGDTIVFIGNMSGEHIGFRSPYNGTFKRFKDEKIKKTVLLL